MSKNGTVEKRLIANLNPDVNSLVCENLMLNGRFCLERKFRDKVIQKAHHTYSIDEFLRNIFPHLQKIISASKCSISLKTQHPLKENTHFYIVVQNGIHQDDIEAQLKSIEKGKFLTTVFEEGRSIIIDLKRNYHRTNSIIAPFGWQGVIQGAVSISNKLTKNNFTDEDRDTLVSCVRDIEYGINIILQKRSHLDDITTFVEQKDPYTAVHSKRVAQLARLIAKSDGLSVEAQNIIEAYGKLHDIGKIGIPDSILLKKGSLDDSEFHNIMKHPEKGETMLLRYNESSSNDFKSGRDIIRHHHEKFDGNGYPDGLGGEDIPKFSRILSVVDSFDAMASTRCYRTSLQHDEISNRINIGIGKQFDPNYARLFLDMLPSLVYADSRDERKLFYSPFDPHVLSIKADSFIASMKSDMERQGFRLVDRANSVGQCSKKNSQIHNDIHNN